MKNKNITPRLSAYLASNGLKTISMACFHVDRDIAAIEARHAEAIKQARREAYEDVAKMIEDDAESVELQHAGGHPDLQIILKATEITREVAGFIREKAGKL